MVRNRLLVRRFILVIAAVLVGSSAFADDHGDGVLTRARAAERMQMHALAGTTLQMQTHGTVR